MNYSLFCCILNSTRVRNGFSLTWNLTFVVFKHINVGATVLRLVGLICNTRFGCHQVHTNMWGSCPSSRRVPTFWPAKCYELPTTVVLRDSWMSAPTRFNANDLRMSCNCLRQSEPILNFNLHQSGQPIATVITAFVWNMRGGPSPQRVEQDS